MAYRSLSFTLLLLLIVTGGFAQQRPGGVMHLRKGVAPFERNIDTFSVSRWAAGRKTIGGKSFHWVRFDHLPTAAEKAELAAAGIVLLDYVPDKVYVMEVRQQEAIRLLKQYGAVAIRALEPEEKIAPGLTGEGAETREGAEPVEVMLAFFRSIPYDTATGILSRKGFSDLSGDLRRYGLAELRCRRNQLLALAALPFVKYIDHARPVPTPLAEDVRRTEYTRDNERANVLQAGLPQGYNLSGDGISVGVCELAGLPQKHLDYADRIIPFTTGSNDIHSTHVNGIVGSAGIIDERYTGYAPQATLLCNGPFLFSPVPAHMVLTTNSYATGEPCDSFGLGVFGTIVDQYATDYPALQNVYAAGNSGQMTCPAYPYGYHTILSGGQSAKNALSVGNTMPSGQLDPASSRGPSTDGRIKPEIVATGDFVISTFPVNTYGTASGTSMSSPAVAGGLALLYQEYRRLHQGADPVNGLMKAMVCNSATDLGNPGPDFNFGFGRMNLLRAVRILDSGHYFTGYSRQDSVDTHPITVPPKLAQLKVMLYWPDLPGSPLAGPSLVNDLDLQVTGPNGVVTLPFILDPSPAHAGDPATRGEDHLNNVEQVVIDHPQPGVYTLRVKGYAIPQGDQQAYCLVYDPVPNGVELSYPFEGAKLVPGETVTVQWDGWGDSLATYRLLFSPDSGASWQPVATGLAADQRQFAWTVPALGSKGAEMRLVRESDGISSTSLPFIIAGTPAIALTPDQCPGTISLAWPRVTGATDYEVMMLHNGAMQPVGATTDTIYYIRGLSPDSVYWITVRSRIGGVAGRRAPALSRQPADGTCAGTAYSGDLAADSLIAPATGRRFTTGAPGAQDTVRLRIRNLSSQPIGGYTVQYSINGSPPISETVVDSLPANGSVIHSFAGSDDFSAAGNYLLTTVVTNPGDTHRQNDTLRCLVRQLDNPPLALSATVTDAFSQAPDTAYTSAFTGLTGTGRFDYFTSSPEGRLRTGSDSAHGFYSRAAVLDFPFGQPAGAYNTLTATYNLSLFDTARHTAGISFLVNSNYSPDSVYLALRGSDQQPWITLPGMALNPAASRGLNVPFELPDLGSLLRAAKQNFSSSFQVRWLHQGGFYGDSYDSIRVYDATADAELLHLDSLAENSCQLGNQVYIHVTLRNNGVKDFVRLPVYYRVDSGATIVDTVPFLATGDSASFVFAVPADLSVPGLHRVEAGTLLMGDLDPANNSKTIALHNQPLISQFPYLENFEQGDGYWYPGGNNGSWAYGEPSSRLIDGAASGAKAWKTNLSGDFNYFEDDYIYSPFFDLRHLQHPAVSFSLALDTDSCAADNGACGHLRWQYSLDSGSTWRLLPVNNIYAWESGFSSPDFQQWHVASTLLPGGLGIVQFRLLFSGQLHLHEGAGVDDIHIYDHLSPIYTPVTGNGSVDSIQNTISGASPWQDFVQDSQLVASIQANGQDLGITEVKTFLHNGAVRNFHGQYYLDRNWVIRSSRPVTGPVKVRLYFTDQESKALLAATDCPTCTKPEHAYRFGVAQYSSGDTREENDSISDDLQGSWSFLDRSKVAIVPFEQGYYAEFTVDHLSEFRLSNGGYDGESWLPVNFLNSVAQQSTPVAVALHWATASEIDIDHFDLERAAGNGAYAQGDFLSRGTVPSKGPSRQELDYDYTDSDSTLKGVYYYRIKAVDSYGNYSYSPVLPVLFSDELHWQLFPNPSPGHFTLQYQLNSGQSVEMAIYNSIGSLLSKKTLQGTGFVQTTELDLSGAAYPAGVYFIRILAPEKKLLKAIKLGK